jgi:hypothetical protein
VEYGDESVPLAYEVGNESSCMFVLQTVADCVTYCYVSITLGRLAGWLCHPLYNFAFILLYNFLHR